MTEARAPKNANDTTDGVRTAGDDGAPAKKSVDRRSVKPNIVGRIVRYYREVVAELRKVIWPNRRELVTYTTVVVVFVAIIVALVAGLDFVFAKSVLKVFG